VGGFVDPVILSSLSKNYLTSPTNLIDFHDSTKGMFPTVAATRTSKEIQRMVSLPAPKKTPFHWDTFRPVIYYDASFGDQTTPIMDISQ